MKVRQGSACARGIVESRDETCYASACQDVPHGREIGILPKLGAEDPAGDVVAQNCIQFLRFICKEETLVGHQLVINLPRARGGKRVCTQHGWVIQEAQQAKLCDATDSQAVLMPHCAEPPQCRRVMWVPLISECQQHIDVTK